MEKVKISDIYKLDNNVLNKKIKSFLRDDSTDDEYKKILYYHTFFPDSYTIFEKISDPPFLFASDKGDFLRQNIRTILKQLENENFIYFDDINKIENLIIKEINFFLNFKLNDKRLSEIIYIQEFPDILKSVMSYLLFGDENIELHTYRSFNDRILPIILRIFNKNFKDTFELKKLLEFSIASGAIGLDIKDHFSASSSIVSCGIELLPYLNDDKEYISNYIFNELVNITKKGFIIDYWDDFINNIENKKIVWITDDYIETIFDIIFIQNLIKQKKNVNVLLIAKNGQYGNDASYNDVMKILNNQIFDEIKNSFNKEFKVLNIGPKMGAMNLKKITSSFVNEILNSDVIVAKGCRIHEMIQGGLNKKLYAGFSVTREYSEAESGYDSSEYPLIFIKSEPGEFVYWGFKGRAYREKVFDEDKVIKIVYSTIEEHEKRKKCIAPLLLIKDLNYLLKNYDSFIKDYSVQFKAELLFIMNRLNNLFE